MPNTRTNKAKTGNLEAAQGDRKEERRTAEQTEQQALNQGMDTGTHDSTRRGVDWGRSYRTRTKTADAKARSSKQKSGTGSQAGRRHDNQG